MRQIIANDFQIHVFIPVSDCALNNFNWFKFRQLMYKCFIDRVLKKSEVNRHSYGLFVMSFTIGPLTMTSQVQLRRVFV